MSTKNVGNKDLIKSLISLVYSQLPNGRFDIAFVSDKLSLSPSQLNRRVKGITGMTVTAFIMKLRINEAKKLLAKSPKYSISDVAFSCGFTDPSHLAKTFKKHTGMTPTEYAHNTSKDDEDFESFIRTEIKKASNKRRNESLK